MWQNSLFLLIVIRLEGLTADIFSTENLPTVKLNFSLSPIYLSRLARQEVVIYEILNQTWVKQLNAPDSLLSNYLSDYESCLGVQNSWKVWDHPWLTFRMIWRFTNIISPLLEYFSLSQDKSVLNLSKMLLESKEVDYPPTDSEDVQPLPYIVVAICNMQHGLDLPAGQMAKGIFGSVSTGLGLTPQQMMTFANLTFRLNFDIHAKDWMEVIETQYRGEVDMDALDRMKTALVTNHDLEFQNKTSKGNLYIFKEHLSSGTKETIKEHELTQWLEKGGSSGQQRERKLKLLALCSNSTLLKEHRPIKKGSTLKCWNDPKKHPYFTVAPLKTELISFSPKIYLYHNFLSDGLMETLETLARPQIIEADGANYGFAWLDMHTIPFFNNTILKLESALGLKIAGNASDDLRITIYPLGSTEGNVHHDVYKAPNLKASEIFADRLSTILIYMKDVAVGGETAFPDLDLLVKPVKGTMLYWENYYPDGRVDWRTFHSLCLSVLGTKIIATTFISKTENMFTKPCRLRNDLKV